MYNSNTDLLELILGVEVFFSLGHCSGALWGGHSRLNITPTHPSSRQIIGIMIFNLHKATITACDQVTSYSSSWPTTYNTILATQSFSWKSHGAAVQCAHYIARNTSTLSSHPPHIHIPRPGWVLRTLSGQSRAGPGEGRHGDNTPARTQWRQLSFYIFNFL